MSSATPGGARRVKVGLVGSQFVSTIHAESFHRCADAELYAVASPTQGNAEKFARRWGIPHHFTDHRQMIADPALDLVVIGSPNETHCPVTVDAAAAGKHVVCEK